MKEGTVLISDPPAGRQAGMVISPDKEKPAGVDDAYGQDSPAILSEIDEESAVDGARTPPGKPPAAKPAAAPPNGGLTAWMQVLGSFFIYFNTWGEFVSLLLCHTPLYLKMDASRSSDPVPGARASDSPSIFN